MITKEQAVTLSGSRAIVHFTGRHLCAVRVGPRGGVSEHITRCRVNGACQTWKRNLAAFRLPVKHGMREYGQIADWNAADWHLESECPALHPEVYVTCQMTGEML